uniref:Amidohydrolase n=1 Tax=candidate division WOR-3 bacterium TaxID=2052148 RepID=A0A7V3UZC4_UNCW3
METLSGYLITEPATPAFPGKIIIDSGKIAAILPANDTGKNVFIAPGFIDSHTHPLENGLAMLFPDLSPIRSIAEAVDLIHNAISSKTDLPLILAFNFNPDGIKEHRYLYRRELDRITREKPVFVYRVDGHSGIANSPALALIPKEKQEGIELDGAGKPTGVVRGSAYEALSALLKRKLPAEIIEEAINLTARQAIQKGVTTIAAMVGTQEMSESEWQIILNALASALIRMIPFLQTWKPDLASKLSLPRVGGCLLLDGSFGSHTAAITGEYADAPGFNGMLYHPDELIVNFLNRSNELALQTAFHAIGDRAIEQLIRSHEKASIAGKNKLFRHRIEHAELLTPELITRIANLNLIISVQPAFEALWGGPGGLYAQRLGQRWKFTNPLNSLLSAGIHIAGGSDAPITPLDPLFGIKAARSLPNNEQSLNPTNAFALFTTYAAYSLKMEDQIGAIKPGFAADLVILNADPRIQPEAQILATYLAGKLVYQHNLWE